jgi:hypothetical protein
VGLLPNEWVKVGIEYTENLLETRVLKVGKRYLFNKNKKHSMSSILNPGLCDTTMA